MKLFWHSNYLYEFRVQLLLVRRVGQDLGGLLFSFLREEPKPTVWATLTTPYSAWGNATAVDPDDGIGLPLFAP